MIKKILAKAGLLGDYVKRSDVEIILQTSMKSMSDYVNPLFASIGVVDAKDLNTSYLSSFYKSLKVRNAKDLIDAHHDICTVILNHETEIRKIVRELPDVISTNKTTARNIGVLSFITELIAYILFLPDFIYMAITDHGNNAYGESKIKSIKSFTGEFFKISVYMADLENNVAGLYKINNSFIISEGNNSSANTLIMEDAGANLLYVPLNMLITTIYSVRRFLVDVDVKKFELLSKKKSLIESRLLEIRRKGEDSPAIKKAIEAYTEEIETVEYKLEKIRSSYS